MAMRHLQAAMAQEPRAIIDIPVTQGFTDVFDLGADTLIRGFIVENYSKFSITILYGRTAPASNRVFDHRTMGYFKESETCLTPKLGLRVDTLPDGTTAPDQGNGYIKLTLDTEPVVPTSTPLFTASTNGIGLLPAGGVPYTAAGAANTAVAIVVPAPGALLRNYLTALALSYSAAPAGGLTIADGATTIFQLDVATANPVPPSLGSGGLRQPTLNQTLTLTLAAGGVGVIGKLNAGIVVAP